MRNEKKTGEKLHGHKETRPVGAVWGAERDAVSYWRVTFVILIIYKFSQIFKP